jgi:hypothetical protein
MLKLFSITKESINDSIKNFLFSYLPLPMKIEDDELHLQKTIDWLVAASENGKGGVSSHYSLIKGKWLNPFPETTGYIIPTLFDYSYFTNDKKYFFLAVKLTEWLGNVQLDNGACMQGTYDEKKGKTAPIVFNTGQNILGFIRTYLETKENKYLNFALNAGDFLVSSIDKNGVWDKNLHRGLKHTINSRTSWALLELNKIYLKEAFIRTAKINLDWVMVQQTENGWFNYGTSRPGGVPNTHFLSYTCEGLIESYKILKEEKYLNAALKTAEKMMRIFEIRRMLHAFWDENWKNRGKNSPNSKGKFICLTGNIQISSVWMQIYELTGDARFLNSAFKMLDYIKTLQDIKSANTGICGGIKGSFPIYGSYSRLMYPNWAAKFFADALMTKIKLKNKLLNIGNK